MHEDVVEVILVTGPEIRRRPLERDVAPIPNGARERLWLDRAPDRDRFVPTESWLLMSVGASTVGQFAAIESRRGRASRRRRESYAARR
jgi:hypothetical protein